MRYGGQVQPRQPWHSQNGAPGGACNQSAVAGPWNAKCAPLAASTQATARNARARTQRARAPEQTRGATICQQEDTWSMQQRTQNSVQQTGTRSVQNRYSSCPRIQPQGWALGVGAKPY